MLEKVEDISWNERVRNEYVLHRVKYEYSTYNKKGGINGLVIACIVTSSEILY
jgi:hypothetical protein